MPSRMIPLSPLFLIASLLGLAGCQAQAEKPAADAVAAQAELLARGEYLVRTSGCNDCHTAGYAENQGRAPTSQWLTGSAMGFHGPWGTTYATNLRLRMQELNEAEWLAYSANLRTRPIMPDFQVRAMTEQDRRAIYRFVRSLGPAGEPAPAYLPPGKAPPAPYFAMVLPPPAPGAAPATPAVPAAR